jgi:hypothetical protein
LEQNQKLLTVKGDSLVHGADSTSLLTNFVTGLIYMLHMHNYSNDRLAVIGKALSQSFVEIINKMEEDDAIDKETLLEARRSIIDLRLNLIEVVDKFK